MSLSKVALIACSALALSACASKSTVQAYKWCPPDSERIVLKADALFKFDKSGLDDILDKGREELTILAQRFNEAWSSIDNIVVTGHTDHLGSDAYNQVLSENRANTVANYLKEKGLNTRFEIIGKGESEIIEYCHGVKQRAELIECLQPNRRVELIISGEKKTIPTLRTQQ